MPVERLLAWAAAVLLVAASLTVVVRSGNDVASAVAKGPGPAIAAEPAAAGKALPPPAPEDGLPLSDPRPLDLAAAGYELPPGASVYAARIVVGDDRPRYDDYVAGGGALADDFWPASTIKVLAALGALDFVRTLGFTGAATVSFASGYRWTIREIYESAVAGSDNLDYDVLIRIAGFDRLNTEFLSDANGFPTTVIQRSYAGLDVRWSPEMTLEEGGRTVVVPARVGRGDYGCPVEGNCTNLFEISEGVRRVVLDAALPPGERFTLSPDDIQALAAALAHADSFFVPGAERALGSSATVQGKPGVAAGRDCVDTAIVTAPAGDRFLLSAAIPENEYSLECRSLSELAAAVLPLLARAP